MSELLLCLHLYKVALTQALMKVCVFGPRRGGGGVGDRPLGNDLMSSSKVTAR